MALGNARTSAIKRAQKEAGLYRILSGLFHQATLEKPELAGLFINRVELSPGKTVCYAYMYTAQGKEQFDKVLPSLTIFKPSMRKAVADSMGGRYTVEIVFAFDEQFEKQQRIEQILEDFKNSPYADEADAESTDSSPKKELL